MFEFLGDLLDDIFDGGDGTSEAESLERDLTRVPELDGEYEVYGGPYELGEVLDDVQGDNVYDAHGDCGLVSITNLLRIAGSDVTEDDVVGYAIRSSLCNYSAFDPPGERGGTTTWEQRAILESLGFDTECFVPGEAGGSLEAMAGHVEAGKGVLIGVNAGYLWENADYIGDGRVNHTVLVTGTVRDPETGELRGFTVCDSGSSKSPSFANFVSVETMEDAYTNAFGADVIVTEKAIR